MNFCIPFPLRFLKDLHNGQGYYSMVINQLLTFKMSTTGQSNKHLELISLVEANSKIYYRVMKKKNHKVSSFKS